MMAGSFWHHKYRLLWSPVPFRGCCSHSVTPHSQSAHTATPVNGPSRGRPTYREPLRAMLENPSVRAESLQANTRHQNLSATYVYLYCQKKENKHYWMMAMVLRIVMVNKPTMSNDRQHFLTSEKKTFTRSFKWRLDMQWDNDFPASSWETALLLPLLHQQERETQRSPGRPVLLLSARRKESH